MLSFTSWVSPRWDQQTQYHCQVCQALSNRVLSEEFHMEIFEGDSGIHLFLLLQRQHKEPSFHVSQQIKGTIGVYTNVTHNHALLDEKRCNDQIFVIIVISDWFLPSDDGPSKMLWGCDHYGSFSCYIFLFLRALIELLLSERHLVGFYVLFLRVLVDKTDGWCLTTI